MKGKRLGPYQVLAPLGSGGMGAVFRAEVVGEVPELDPGRVVALKVIHTHLLEAPGFFKRFMREAQIGQRVAHENVVRTFDCDALLHEGVQQNFLVMEYVEGQTLRDLLKELERVPEELCRHIGREVAKGLAAIHEAGVVHRDLKPENVLITADHLVKVMDLGVARLQDEAIRLSTAGAFVGSLEYAAPEQFKTADGEPDGRADLHALGVLLYELSTGQHPYRDEDASKVLRRILDEVPRKAGEVNPQLSPFFEEVVQALIAKDRDERFPAASDLAGVLDEGEQSDWWKQRAQALRIETKRPLRRVRIPRETALYGRDDDLAKLHALYEKAKAGDGQALLIEGEAGIGKTRLVDEFVGRLHQAGEDVNFLYGSYPPGGAATASGAFSTAFREQFGDVALEQVLEEYLARTPLLIPAFAALLRGDALPTGAQGLTQDSLQTVFVDSIRALAAERPTIVLIDDLHFAPTEGRALFAGLAMALADLRVLLVGTGRHGLPDSWLVNLERLQQTSRVSMSRLGPKDLVALLQEAFRSERLATELSAQIALKSDGNPFFAFEIIRGLREGQLIRQQEDGSWISTQAIADIEIPSSVTDMIKARIADLGEVERNLLDVASCFGFEFDPGLAGAVLGLTPIEALQAFGRVESKHRLIRSAGRNCVFDHHQVHETLYVSLLEQLREAYHAGIGEALEARVDGARLDPKTLDGEVCVDLCEHFLQGRRGEQAVRYLWRALVHLREGYLNARVIELADRALGIEGLLSGRARIDALSLKNGALNLLGRSDEQEAVLSEMRALAEAEDDEDLLAWAEQAMATLMWATSRYEQAREHAEAARLRYERSQDRKGEAGARSVLGNIYIHLDRLAEARAQHERVLALHEELGDTDGRSAALINLGIVLGGEGRIDEARTHYERGIELARECGNRAWEANASSNLAGLLSTLGLHDESRARYEHSLRINREIGNRRMEGNVTGNFGRFLGGQDLLADALRHHRRSLALHQETGYRGGEVEECRSLGSLMCELGQFYEAREYAEEAVAVARELGKKLSLYSALLAAGVTAEEQGDTSGAEAYVRESLALARELDHASATSDALRILGNMLVDQERADEAAPLFEESLRLARSVDDPALEVTAMCCMAALPDGNVRAAEEAFATHQEKLTRATRRILNWVLYRVTENPAYLTRAKHLLDHLLEHAPEEYRESMRKNVGMNREILEAWEGQGDRGNDGATRASSAGR